MNHKLNILKPSNVLTFAIFSFLAINLFAETPLETPLELLPQSSLWLEGDSTLHPYTSTATVLNVEAVVNLEDKPLGDAITAGKLTSVSLEIPIANMESGKKGLDKNLSKTLEADKHPSILYSLKNYTVEKSTHAGFSHTLLTHGQLTVAGKQIDIDIPLLFSSEDEIAHFKGQRDLRMTDFGIKPPSMFLGTVKTRDEIIVFIDLFFKK